MKFYESDEYPEITEEMLSNFASDTSNASEYFEDYKTIEEIRAERVAKQQARKEAKKKERRSKLVNNLTPLAAFALLICTVAYLNSLQFGLVISYKNEQIATVENAEVVEEATSIINNKIIMKSLDTLEDEPRYKVAVINNNSEFQNPTELSRTILANDNVLEDEVCGVFVDGVLVGAVESKEDAEKVLNSILEDAKKDFKDMGDVAEVQFNGSVYLQVGLFAKSSVVDSNTLKDRLINNVDLSYKIIVLQKQNVKIKYKTEYVVDDTKPSGYEQVTVKGVPGDGYITNRVTYVDGAEVSSEREKVTATKRPVNEVITVSADNENAGTAKRLSSDADSSDSDVKKDTEKDSVADKNENNKADKQDSVKAEPESKSTDSEDNPQEASSSEFIWPAPSCYSITNEFGYQGEKLHKGIDISGSNAEGQPIVASAGGYVTTAVIDYGTENYGCYLIIDHGNGYRTLYAQCSDIYVAPGTYVEQGETIAAVGSTGDSTGAHLHFEVILNGEYVNPTNYLY